MTDALDTAPATALETADAPAAVATEAVVAAAPAKKERPTHDAGGRPIRWADLDNPIIRGGKEIYEICLRKPLGGAMRGTNLNDLWKMDVNAMSIVVPRISEPKIPQAEFMAMEPEDVATICGEVTAFLLTKQQKESAGLET